MLTLIRKIFVLLRVKKYLSNSIVLSIVHSNGLLSTHKHFLNTNFLLCLGLHSIPCKLLCIGMFPYILQPVKKESVDCNFAVMCDSEQLTIVNEYNGSYKHL